MLRINLSSYIAFEIETQSAADCQSWVHDIIELKSVKRIEATTPSPIKSISLDISSRASFLRSESSPRRRFSLWQYEGKNIVQKTFLIPLNLDPSSPVLDMSELQDVSQTVAARSKEEEVRGRTKQERRKSSNVPSTSDGRVEHQRRSRSLDTPNSSHSNTTINESSLIEIPEKPAVSKISLWDNDSVLIPSSTSLTSADPFSHLSSPKPNSGFKGDWDSAFFSDQLVNPSADFTSSQANVNVNRLDTNADPFLEIIQNTKQYNSKDHSKGVFAPQDNSSSYILQHRKPSSISKSKVVTDLIE